MGLYRTTCALAVKGDRIERGAEIELTDEEASLFDPADLELVSSTEGDEPEEIFSD